ncbi:lipopolysaccharide biosynthesis protein [Blautia marasmi]|uniref:lipopolysaccharide biosynthesis protein n=1 Tax=Blautia marasmi TaxID=1917868 RepID=UPI000CF2B566|nr:hypothetical protein [Blautia marasmi]
MKVKKLLKNLSYSVLANGSNTFISMLLVLFVPKVLGIKEYSYWQLYLFYSSYIGFLHFGWADGVYLRFGGKKYEELDKEYFTRQFWLLTFAEFVICLLINIFANFGISDSDKHTVISAVSLCCILQIPRTFLQYILQTTNRIVDYARNYLFEKIIYACLVIICLAFGYREYKLLIGADLFARGVTLILLSHECKDIIFRKISNLINGFGEAWINVTVGIKLMFANIASQLLLGIVRWTIQNHWSVETFGKVSLSITASNLLITFISAVSIVLYPMLKNISMDKYVDIYIKIRNVLMIFVLGLLIIYYPARVILSWWLPQYADSLKYMALLFPMCVFESKMTMLVNTYLKVLRKEKAIMFINWGSVIFTLMTAGVLVYGMDNLVLAIASLTILIGIRCSAGEILISRYLNYSLWKDMAAEWGLSLLFIISGWFFDSWLMVVIYGTAYVCYLFWKRKTFSDIVEIMRKVLRTK